MSLHVLNSSAMHTNTVLMQNFVVHIAMNVPLRCTPALSTFTMDYTFVSYVRIDYLGCCQSEAAYSEIV